MSDTCGQQIEQRTGNVLTLAEAALEKFCEFIEIRAHRHPCSRAVRQRVRNLAEGVEDEEVFVTVKQGEQFVGGHLPMFAVEALRPPLDSRGAQGRSDSGDAPLDPPRRHRRPLIVIPISDDAAESEEDEGKSAGREDEFPVSIHLGDGECESTDGSGDDTLAQPRCFGEGAGRIVSSGDPSPRGCDESLDDPIGGLLDRRTAAAGTILEVGTARPAT